MLCSKCGNDFKIEDHGTVCPKCHTDAKTSFAKGGDQTAFRKRNRVLDDDSEEEFEDDNSQSNENPQPQPTQQEKVQNITDVYSWINTSLSYYTDSLISVSVEQSLLDDAKNSGIDPKRFMNEYRRYLERKDRHSEQSLIDTALDYCSVTPNEEKYVLLPANRQQNILNKIKRAHNQDETKSKIWLTSFMKEHRLISEKEAKEKLFDWLEGCVVIQRNMKKKVYTKKEREEIDSLCPHFDFLATNQGKERRDSWINSWLTDHGFTEKKGGFFSNFFK